MCRIRACSVRLSVCLVLSDNAEIAAPRVMDLQRHLQANLVLAGEYEKRRIHDYVMFARTVPNATQFLVPNNCIFCPGDRDDALIAVTISATAGMQMACLVLTGSTEPSASVWLCAKVCWNLPVCRSCM